MKCPDCSQEAVLRDSEIIYGKSYGYVWVCPDYPKCDNYVGCHKGTSKALGTLCGPEIRSIRIAAHSAFDRIWRNKIITRKAAYKKLAEYLAVQEVHIGSSNIKTCKHIIEWSQQFNPKEEK